MNKKIFYFLLIVIMYGSSQIYASSFLSIGSGFVEAENSSSENKINIAIPLTLGYQYTSGYRDSFLFNANINWTLIPDNNVPGDLLIISTGIMYIAPFSHYRSNITEKTFEKNTCLGIVLLPLTIMRDAMTEILQFFLPQSPMIFFGPAIIKEQQNSFINGFSTGAGFTNGNFDIVLKYTQNIRINDGLKRDIYTAGIEFSLNFPLQKQFIRSENLVE